MRLHVDEEVQGFNKDFENANDMKAAVATLIDENVIEVSIKKGAVKREKILDGYTKVVVETDEEKPITIAEITEESITPADGYRVRLTPTYN